MNNADKAMTLFAVFTGILLPISAAFYFFVYYKKRRTYEKLHNDYPNIIEFKKKLAAHELKRHEVIDGYMLTILHYRSKLQEHYVSKKLFKNWNFSKTCANIILSNETELVEYIVAFLNSDISKYVEDLEVRRCEKISKKLSHILFDIEAKHSEQPDLSLQMYFDYFVELIGVCETITGGIKDKEQIAEIEHHLQSLNTIFEQYKQIAKCFDTKGKNEFDLIANINDRYAGRICEIESLDDICDTTIFLIFDDLIFFVGKFYKEMDSIEVIVNKQNA